MPSRLPRPIRKLWRSFQALLQAISSLFLRSLFLPIKNNISSKAGFVLPTTILVLLVVGLFAGALISRSGDRAEDVIRDREAQRIDNIAAPAVERAKAKLEFLFNRDSRFPASVPSEIYLRDMMLYDDKPADSEVANLIQDNSGNDKPDPYELSGETRIDLDGNGKDNAWKYETDLDGDGTSETVAYSILMQSGIDGNDDGKIEPSESSDIGYWSDETTKANNLITRTGPLSIKASQGKSSDCNIPGLKAEEGWFASSATSVRKNFQVNVFVENENEANKTLTALEFQQDRQLDKGNKFGVWFRYDLLIHPGPQFNLNGAVHTDGNLITWNNSLQFYLVSDSDSCIYSEDASIIEVTEVRDDDDNIEYQGQAISTGNDTEEVDLFDPDGSPSTEGFSPDNDSVSGTPNPSSAVDQYGLDPLVLYTEDRLVSRGNQNPDGSYDTSSRDSDWDDSDLATRIRNDTQQKPYVDDLYRADDRWGPKPIYGKGVALAIDEDLTDGFDKNGKLIESADLPSDFSGDIDLLIGLDPPDDFPEEVGLDGYWERRSYTQGLRIIVGQRLELGNAFGWQGGGNDPLNPATSTSGTGRANEQRQLKTLRDNLAAVQATAVYHYNDDNDAGSGAVGDFPVAILATTAHPGTQETVIDSTTFDRTTVDLDSDGANEVLTNFLEGKGTNGWEFHPPGSTFNSSGTSVNSITTNSAFAGLVDSETDDPLRRALMNLAYFAGDPDGDFPPTQEDNTSGSSGVTHPYPQLTMWGDYSNLRQVIDQLEGGTNYGELSLADQTTLQTAASTLGMLAYNLNYLEEQRQELIGDGKTSDLVSLGEQLQKLVDDVASSGNPEIGKDGGDVVLCFSDKDGKANGEAYFKNDGTIGEKTLNIDHCASSLPDKNDYDADYYSGFTQQQWIQALELWAGVKSGSNVPDQEDIENLEFISFYNQIRADREFGFNTARVLEADTSAGSYSGTFDKDAKEFTTEKQHGGVDKNTTYSSLSCDPNIFGLEPEQPEVGLALAACQENDLGTPKYPSLYYLFPVAEHTHDGTLASTVTNSNAKERLQPNGSRDLDGDGTNEPAEPYITDSNSYINSSAVNSDVIYRVIDDSDADDGYEDPSAEDSFSAIALPPRPRNQWTLPNTTTRPTTTDITSGISGLDDPADLTDAAINEIDDDGTTVYIPFLDKGMYNGRQQMSVRVLNIDLGLLRENQTNFGTGDIENWLPNSGLVYAFREDAIREDGIARPNEAAWSSCNTESNLTDTDNDCFMDPSIPRDPPKQADNGVSPKPVDYIADPDRRPHGFRLSNGSKLGRINTTRGLSFITDNPAYILGDFNFHSREEFDKDNLLKDDYSNFYNRENLDTGFAISSPNEPDKSENDDWRPSEILADAITFLSNSYCDGVIENAILANNNGCDGSTPSYRNTRLDSVNNGGNNGGSSWDREDPSNTNSPIAVNRNGQLLFNSGNTFDDLLNTNNNHQELNNPSETTINSVIVQGLSPTRENESYGGLHNFPRFNEDWEDTRGPSGNGDTDLNIDGSLIQLNFSNYDTANLDQQDTFQPATSAQAGNDFEFYTPPNRKWGYDVALQYNPPGPIVERLLSKSGLRSEIYQEIKVNDPYIQQLCKAATDNSPTCPSNN